jgi:hypothetical protein
MNPLEAKRRVETDPDFIYLKRFDFSMKLLLERYPDGCPDKVIASALMLPEHEVEELYQKAIARLRIIMGVESD